MNPFIKLLLAGLLSLGLCACASADKPAERPSTADTPIATPAVSTPLPTATPAVTEAPAEAAPTVNTVPGCAGSYTYHDGTGLWTLSLRDSGPYTLQKEGLPPHTGESWVVNADGSVSCSPTDLWTEIFADGNGCTTWVFYPDGRCAPVMPG